MLHQDHRPRGLAIASLTSANAEFNRWLRENCHSQITDALGQIWTCKATVQILPDPVNLHAAIHRLSFDIKTEISRKILLDLGILDMSKDQRLLSLMDNSIISVLYQRPAFDSDSAEKIRTQAAEDLVKIRARMKKVDLSQMYKNQMGRWVDRQFHMAYPPIVSAQIKINLEV
ncbi:MAG: hypothetical protein EOP07_06100 [Proteobacteria bacterium]|nr:MAG: hypothetical protein EOP07_06100 [Pseudomonadota bacterium]